MFSKSGSHFKYSFCFTFSFIVVLAIGEIPQIRMLFLRGYHLEKNCESEEPSNKIGVQTLINILLCLYCVWKAVCQ